MTSTPLPVLVLYVRVGCHLCREARELLGAILAERGAAGLAAPAIEERDIDTDPEWQRAYFATIPVVEIGDRRLELATSAAKLRRLLVDTLDGRGAADSRGGSIAVGG